MPDGFDIDHTSFGVRDALAAGRWARRELGATPVFGEVLPEFRYLLMHVGDADGGARLEFMEPVDPDGFLGRFVERHGERPHHLTFMVPDIVESVAAVRGLGLKVVGEDYEHPPWREAFVMPDRVHGVVVQLGTSDRDFPSPRELLATRARPADAFPSNRGATGQEWWVEVWDEAPGPTATAVSTTLVSADLAVSDALFRDVLHADIHASTPDSRHYAWERSDLVVVRGDAVGVAGVTVRGLDHPRELAHTPITPEGALR